MFVADELYGSLIESPAIAGFLRRFDGDPDPEFAVLSNNQRIFGELRRPANSSKLPVFIVDTHGASDGYFCSWCAEPELHLDGVLLSPLDGDRALSIAAHESYHAISRGYDGDEAGWVEETLAEAAMVANGFSTDRDWLVDFLHEPNVNWGPGADSAGPYHYGAALAFGAYLWEQGESELMRAITAEPGNGWAGLDAALASVHQPKTSLQLFLDMAVALYVNDPRQGHGFSSIDLPEPVHRLTLEAGQSVESQLAPFGLAYLSFGAGVRALRVAGPETLQMELVRSTHTVLVAPVKPGQDVPLDDAAAALILTATDWASYEVTAVR